VEERHSELLIMGHESGSLKFWVHNSSSMTPLKGSKSFQREKSLNWHLFETKTGEDKHGRAV